MEKTEENGVKHLLICGQCNVNPVELENLQEETCSFCLEEGEDTLARTKELDFNYSEHRRDDRQSLDLDNMENEYDD